jgi:hypothetical protein
VPLIKLAYLMLKSKIAAAISGLTNGAFDFFNTAFYIRLFPSIGASTAP